jgi:acetolactate synthase regulatory subunit
MITVTLQSSHSLLFGQFEKLSNFSFVKISKSEMKKHKQTLD